MARSNVSTPVLRYIEDRKGENCYVDEMAAELRLHPAQVRGAVYGLIRRGQPIERVQAGKVFRWNPKTKGAEKEVTLRLVGKTSDGSLVLEDESGRIAIAKWVSE